MGIRRDRIEHVVATPGPDQQVGRDVEPVDVRVDLKGGPGGGGAVEDRFEVELDARTLADATPGEVADDVDRRVGHGGEDALGLLRCGEIEVRMDAGDTPVEVGQERRVVVNGPVGIDVELCPVQDGQPGVLGA